MNINTNTTKLIKAIKENDEKSFDEAIGAACGIDIKYKGLGYKSLLHMAVEKNNNNFVESLVNAGVDPNQKDRDGKTPLHYAAEKRCSKDFIERLLNYKADVNIKDNTGKMPHEYYDNLFASSKEIKILLTPKVADTKKEPAKPQQLLAPSIVNKEQMQNAQYNNTIQLVAAIQCNDATKSLEDFDIALGEPVGIDVKHTTVERESLLHLAVAKGNAYFVEKLIAAGVNPNEHDSNLKTPLHHAVEKGDESMSKTLLVYRGNPNIKDGHGKTALHYAVEERCSEDFIALLLNKYNADVNIKDKAGKMPHQYCKTTFDVQKEIKNLIKSKVVGVKKGAAQSIHATPKKPEDKQPLLSQNDKYKNTAKLVAAIKEVNKKNFDEAINAACGINKEYEQYPLKSLLHLAVESGEVHFVEKLISAGVNVNKKDGNGKAPLHYAVEQRNKEAAELLITKGHDINLNIQDNHGKAPLHYAVEMRDYDLIKLLIDNKADVNISDNFKKTPLHCTTNNATIVQNLIDNGANVHSKDIFGKIPVEYCTVLTPLKIKYLLCPSKIKLGDMSSEVFNPIIPFSKITDYIPSFVTQIDYSNNNKSKKQGGAYVNNSDVRNEPIRSESSLLTRSTRQNNNILETKGKNIANSQNINTSNTKSPTSATYINTAHPLVEEQVNVVFESGGNVSTIKLSTPTESTNNPPPTPNQDKKVNSYAVYGACLVGAVYLSLHFLASNMHKRGCFNNAKSLPFKSVEQHLTYMSSASFVKFSCRLLINTGIATLAGGILGYLIKHESAQIRSN